jgi:uncharacterized protein YyaL (SSP411 family)
MPNPTRPLLLVSGLLACLPAAGAAEHLRGESSAFLRSNADSPVDWLPWGEPAFARARAEQKPLFVFVGSFTNELARSMRIQTFANPEASKWLNAQFVCVMIDRDEHPDLASLYEAYVVQVKQLGGWPLNIWLTPDLLPFDGAAYLAPSEEWGRPGFLKAANEAKNAWATDPAGCRARAKDARAQLAPDPRAAPLAWSAEKARARLAAEGDAWMATFDAPLGGFTSAPKSPEPELLRFLLRESPAAREGALKTLRALAASAVRDPLDGGFFRYATDSGWNLPYPQKTLSDQARIALAYLDAAQGPDAPAFEDCARGALDFALAGMGHADGTFASAIDATGDEYAGYYAWTSADIDKALGPGSAAFKRGHGVDPAGNVAAADDPSGLYASRNLLRSSPADGVSSAPDAARLRAVRDLRRAPPRDERATAGAHGLILAALARAGSQLGERRYLDAAKRLFGAVDRDFVVSKEGDIRRLAGFQGPAAPEDYAALALGCRELGRAEGGGGADALASRLVSRMDALFYDPGSRHYFSAADTQAPGMFTRTLAAGEPPAPESLALLAGENPERAKAILDSQLDSLDEESVQAPGDQLLAIALSLPPGRP